MAGRGAQWGNGGVSPRPPLEWRADNDVKLWPRGGDEGRAGIDPYSYWLLVAGRDFDPASFAQARDPRDFLYVGAMDHETLAGCVDGDLSLFEILEIDGAGDHADVAAIQAALAENSGGKKVTPFFFPLPLRRRSVPERSAAESQSDIARSFGEPSDGAILDPNSGAADLRDGPHAHAGRPVIIGCIDDATHFAHERFRDSDGRSRVEFAWVQDGDAAGQVPFGREWTRQEIDDEIRRTEGDEDALLRGLGLVDFTRPGRKGLARRASHGTHVLDLMAGADPADPLAAQQRIISVSLPSLVTLETSGATLGQFFANALHYILVRARQIETAYRQAGRATSVPVVVGFSYGIAGGPHTGGHLVERLIEYLVDRHRGRGSEARSVAVCLPAGNGNLARGHARRRGQGPISLCLPWRLPAGDPTSSYLEIWMPEEARDVAVTIAWPGGKATRIEPENATEPGAAWILSRGADAPVVARLTVDAPGADISEALPDLQAATGTVPRRKRILLAVVPTERRVPAREPAPPGLWEVTVEATLTEVGAIEAWIQRDDAPFGFSQSRVQSYVEGSDPRAGAPRFTAMGDLAAEAIEGAEGAPVRAGTLNGLATGASPVVVAGYRAASPERALALYSGSAAENRTAPDIAAPSDRSRALPGVIAAGSRSGTRVPLGGTSVAVPQAVRALAARWATEANLRDAATLLSEMAAQHEREIEAEADAVSPLRAGAGRLPPDPELRLEGGPRRRPG